MRVYIAGPYSAETYGAVEANVQAAIEAARRIQRERVYCYIPHLCFYVNGDSVMALYRPDMKYGDGGHDKAHWTEHGMAFLETCQALVYLAHSPGTDKEIFHARRLMIPVCAGVKRFLEVMGAEYSDDPA